MSVVGQEGFEPPVLLAIEDEEPVVGLLAAVASTRSMRMVAARTGTEAFAALDRIQPAVITLDLVLPDLDGFAILDRVHRRPALAAVPVIVLTVLSEPQFQRRAYALGALDFVPKPFSVDVLGAKLEALLRIWRACEGARQQAEARNSLVRAFAHEVRNPISAIGSAAQILQRPDCTPAQRQRFSRAIENESDRVAGLVRQYLEHAAPPLSCADEINVRVLLEEIRDINLLSEPARGRVAIDCAPSLPVLHADRARLKQVVLNLVTNAISATAQGGVVAIAARQENHRLVLSVSDTGVGISSEDMPRIFDETFSKKGGGRGLGLSISRRIVEQHGGELRVESTPGGGTVFSAWLPLDDKAAAE